MGVGEVEEKERMGREEREEVDKSMREEIL
jgi:hypothetical protein